MTPRRQRTRHRTAIPPPADPYQDRIDAAAEELAVLWQSMRYALGRDSAGLIKEDRHATGAAKGSAASINVDVVDTRARVRKGLTELAAEAVRLLNLDRSKIRIRQPLWIIRQLPDWHRSLAGRGQPLADHIRKDTERWLSDVRGAIGTRRRDKPLGVLCPEHRADKPTELRIEGAKATIAPSLLAGPPRARRILEGPVCSAGADDEYVCLHTSCSWIRDRFWVPDGRWIQARRLVDARGQATDWVITGDGEICWLADDGAPALRWQESTTVVCRHCRRAWSDLGERRMLARQLAALGDGQPTAAASIVAP